jgi:predicted nucleic acid-binding protein
LNVILDASSSINLHRGGALEVVFRLTSFAFVFHMGYIVRSECGNLQGLLDSLVVKGSLVMLSDIRLGPQEFTDILNLYDLGLGDTECIAFAKKEGLIVCTDDKAARKAAIEHLGTDRALGSLRLIRECVCQGLLTSHAACLAYETMRAQGAYLPVVSSTYFGC